MIIMSQLECLPRYMTHTFDPTRKSAYHLVTERMRYKSPFWTAAGNARFQIIFHRCTTGIGTGKIDPERRSGIGRDVVGSRR